MKNKKAHDHLVRARTSLLLDHFFFGRLALHLKLVESESTKTLAVDGKHIFYNPEFVLTLNADLTKSAIVHEVSHCMFDHMVRRSGRSPGLWNQAGDYAINQIIKTAGFRLGDNWLYEQRFEGMSAEHIYDLLKEEQEKNGPGGAALCDILDAAESQAEMSEISIEWKIAVAQAAHTAKQHGQIPKGLERFIEEQGKPQVPWREVLQRFVTELAQDDYAWSRPSKKFLAQGMYMPSLYSERMGEIAVVIDTSGSIDQPTLNAFGDEIKAIVNSVRPNMTTVIYCDAAINKVVEFAPEDELHFEMQGGGGTDFRPPFKMIEARDDKPVALVYLTDMYGAFPAQEPEYPVLWCATSGVTGPFGETLRIDV